MQKYKLSFKMTYKETHAIGLTHLIYKKSRDTASRVSTASIERVLFLYLRCINSVAGNRIKPKL
jgi:hypothetical protein